MKITTKIDIDEAKAHLGAALGQMAESDDLIIMEHVRDALIALGDTVSGRVMDLFGEMERRNGR